MSQVLVRPGYGRIKIVKSWVIANGQHVAEVEGGGYCYLSGLPVQRLDELNGLVMSDEDWQRAVDWFDSEKERKTQVEKTLVIKPDGGFEFSDGSPVSTYNDITGAIPPGPLQDAALDWFAKERVRQEDLEKIKASPVGGAAARVAEGEGPKMPPKKVQGRASSKRRAPKTSARKPASSPEAEASA